MGGVITRALGVLLALAFVTTASAANADGKSPATARPLANLKPVSATLTGSFAGAFSYFSFDYPGDGSQATLTFNFSPNDPATANAVGVDVWQGSTLLATANGISPTPGSNTVTFSSTTAGPVLVQVYNYEQGVPVTLQLDLSGNVVTPAAPAPTPAPVASPTTGTPAGTTAGTANAPISLTKPATGSLPGSTAGSFAYFTLPYPGDSSAQTVTLSFSPNGPDVASAVFVNVYQNGILLSGSSGMNAATPGQLSVSYGSSVAGPVLIQVANYNPSTTISYTLSH